MAHPATATDLVLDLPWGQVAARRWGQAGARPLLACHGWLDNAASFDRLAPLLVAGGEVDLLAVDLPGHGHSTWLAGGYSQPTQATCVLAILDALGWQQAGLIGHSMGAGIACLLAASVPERVSALICLDALGQLSAPLDATVPRLRKHLLSCLPGLSSTPRQLDSVEAGIALRQQRNQLDEDAAAGLVQRGVVQRDGRWYWRYDPRLTEPSATYLHEAQVQAVLGAIGCPTLLIEADPPSRFIDPLAQQQRRDCIAGLQHRVLPGSHHLHLDNAAAVADAVLTFLNASRPKV